MVQKQINLTLPPNLQEAAEKYSERFGFKNIQDLATEALREKVFFQTDYDKELTGKERELIDKYVYLSTRDKRLLSTEEELDKALLE